MSNTQIATSTNPQRLLETLATNLGVDFISNGSNLKKMADAYSNENLVFQGLVNNALDNMFLSTATAKYVEMAGQQNGIYRKKYRSVGFGVSEYVAYITVPASAIVSDINAPMTPFRRGDTITVNGQFIITFRQDINLSNSGDIQYVAATVTSIDNASSFSIPQKSVYTLTSPDPIASIISNSFLLTFSKSLGISVINENISDYKARIYEANYIANNGANSLMASLTKEVPLILFLESDAIETGRSIKLIYVYTDNLILNGEDSDIDDLIIPLIESNLQNRCIQGTIIEVAGAVPLKLQIVVNSTLLNTQPLQSVLDKIQYDFNQQFSTSRGSIYYEDVINFILPRLTSYGATDNGITINVISSIVSHVLTLDSTSTTPIDIPMGRFLRLDSLLLL